MIRVIQECRDGLLTMAGTSQGAEFECVLVQGGGTFAIESVVTSVVPHSVSRCVPAVALPMLPCPPAAVACLPAVCAARPCALAPGVPLLLPAHLSC